MLPRLYRAVLAATMLSACAPPPFSGTDTVSPQNDLALSKLCPAVATFPAGTRPPERTGIQSQRSGRDSVDSEDFRTTWNTLAFFVHCTCDNEKDVEDELANEATARARMQEFEKEGRDSKVRSVTLRKHTPPSPGIEYVQTFGNGAYILRGILLAKSSCKGTYSVFEPNPVIADNRRVADRWFQSLRYRDGTPVPYAPLSGEWTRTRFE